MSVLLLVTAHHSHVSLRLPDLCLLSDEPGAKAEAVPTLVLKKRPSLLIDFYNCTELISVGLV